MKVVQLSLIPAVTSSQKPIPPQHQIPVILAKYYTPCGFCRQPILKGQPIYRMESGRWADVHDVNDKDIMNRGGKLVDEAMLEEQSVKGYGLR